MEKNYWRSSKVFFIVLNIFLVSFSSVASADNGEATKPIVENTGYTFPAEWEKQSAVWLVWEWDEFGESTTDEQHKVTAQIIQALHFHNVKVELILQTGGDSKEEVLNFLSAYNVDPKKINFREYKKPYL
ncbi:hypothetical protein [Aneurinibacillus migulanus]|uniref:Uncharacterized protein n=1 Tax=Aneurinibacillus migulanus TaxID=47500 RepID=A0A0D1WJ93_ANEMI|nr:hypothetical protein [Aneurinibacillus migulanus]KIV58615.1 hypothetical protein TS65_04245 [Aneurinibacillus migulanus]KON96298.1 hypothetical protein AF333_13235 [Aneurinibacillus migulanus]MED0892214.1 hypothetical protein [Aneurinibacillus migulanus]MED1615834.1 hypothetical protein [Aneurinibacillus migulanus]SDI25640.1 hypothetical protein SAMN04487909_102295 [Aneurinibacillus migulanus]